ncbi:hypothetical protein ACFO1B_21120 [Dactylosporangium siamense]|uniref:Uncharacterized protein n=1 Tax=Dactylosporangium siamense TaxID=685454 RepID=A0A919PQQ5_9ACTN|nr:hypothetical protein [Dactylosporangium siamense]GIG46760.1 hypothetical protein Dsi01nite_048010 [Dactylosporangium siamense]
MNAQTHPDWCARRVCTAYLPGADEYHRSEPLVVKTDDPAINLFISKIADPDGSHEHIELSMLQLSDGQPWHLTEPLAGRELLLPSAAADAACRALAELVDA